VAFKWDFYNYLGYSFDTEKGLIMLLTMPAYYMEQGCNGRASVHLSVPLTDSSSRGQWVCCQVLCGQEIDRYLRRLCCRRRRSAANAGSIMLRAEGGGSTCSCWPHLAESVADVRLSRWAYTHRVTRAPLELASVHIDVSVRVSMYLLTMSCHDEHCRNT